VENRGTRVNMNKTKVMISGERQKVMQKAVRWPHGVCGRGVGNNSIQCTTLWAIKKLVTLLWTITSTFLDGFQHLMHQWKKE